MTLLTNTNTFAATVNELMLGFYLNGKKWFDPEAKKVYEANRVLITPEEHDAQIGRALAMQQKFLEYARIKGYSHIKKIYWTARPGALQAAVGKDIETHPKENPTDILVQFSRGPAQGFLGISAKSTAIRGDVGFKNPGLGTIENALGLKLEIIVDTKIQKAVKIFGLSEIASKRKSEIMSNRKVRIRTQEMGSEAQSEVIDSMLIKYKRMRQDDIQEHLMSVWMNASSIFPPYVKVIGTGVKEPYSARVEDVLKNDKLSAINSGRIQMAKAGNETIAVAAAGKHIMKIRAKFKDEKLASSFKFSGDPWN